MGLLSRFFRREPPKEILDRRPECGRWYVGDLAVCIDDQWDGPGTGPRKGEIRRVVGIRDGLGTWNPRVRAINLILEGYAPDAYGAYAFRKVQHDAEPADAEFTAKIKGRKPVKAGA